MRAMKRTFRNRVLPWWYWRALANRLARRAEGEAEPVIGEWVAGTNTTLSIAGGRARATAVGANNPRISREVTGLVEGQTYHISSNVYQGTASGDQLFRVSDTANLTLGSYMNVTFPTGGAVDDNFEAPAGGTVYIGIVAICDTDGQYAETDEDFVLTVVA